MCVCVCVKYKVSEQIHLFSIMVQVFCGDSIASEDQ